jgi:uncharacterized membrane protein YpjA
MAKGITIFLDVSRTVHKLIDLLNFIKMVKLPIWGEMILAFAPAHFENLFTIDAPSTILYLWILM